MKVLYVGIGDERLSKFGGYEHIVNYPGADYINSKDCLFGFIHTGKKGKKINIFFQFITALLIAHRYDVVHFFIVDFYLDFKIPKILRKRTKFVATLHLNSSSFSNLNMKNLKQYEPIICLSSNEARRLNEMGYNSVFIPHGFDKPVFKICNSYLFKVKFNINKINICYSGTNYRDFDTLINVLKYCCEEKREIIFHIFGIKDNQKKVLCNYSNVVLYPHVDDNAYYSLISSCDYNFLPLLFATANNALLEAQSLGITSILPNIVGVLDYADMANNLFYDKENIYTIFHALKKRQVNESIISFSESFKWDSIYAQLYKIYIK